MLLNSTDHVARPPIRLAALEVQFSLSCRITEHEGEERTATLTVCHSAWNKDPVSGVIGIQSGPRG